MLDLAEIVGASAIVLPDLDGPGASRRTFASTDDRLASMEGEVRSLEALLDASRGIRQGGPPGLGESYAEGAILQHPGDRDAFADDDHHRAAVLRVADELRVRNVCAGARPLYERLLAPPSPESGPALVGAIWCSLRLGEHPGAVEFLEKVRRLWSASTSGPPPPVPPEAVYLAGTAEFRRTDLPADVRDNRALEILARVEPPFDVPAAYLRGALLVRARELDAAIPEFETCERLPATAPRQRAQQEMCRLALARIDGQRWPWDVEQHWYARIPPDSPLHREVLYEQAWSLARAGSDRTALALADEVVRGDPASVLALKATLVRADALAHLGRFRESLSTFGAVRRQAVTNRDLLDRALRSERGPAAYLAWFGIGDHPGSPPRAVPPPLISQARASREVERARDAWGAVDLASQVIARSRTVASRIEGARGRPVPGSPDGDAARAVAVLTAVAERARTLDARLADEEASSNRRGSIRDLRLRLRQLQVRTDRDARRVHEVGSAMAPTALEGGPSDAISLAEAEREVALLREQAREALGLQVHKSLLQVRTELEQAALEADRGIVEVALTRTQNAEKRLESLMFRRSFEASLPWKEGQAGVLAAIEDQGRLAEAEEQRAREEAIAQLDAYVQAHEDDPVYTPQALSRLAELQVEVVEGGKGTSARRPGGESDAARRLTVAPRDCARAVELQRRLDKGFPGYRQKDSLYFLAAYCMAEAGQPAQAREAYAGLIRRYPNSPHATEARVRIGDLEFEEGRPESLARAAEAYSRAAAGEDVALREHARYMLGWTRYRQGDLLGALQTLEPLLARGAPGHAPPSREVALRAATLLATVLADPRWQGLARARTVLDGSGAHLHEAEVYRRLGDEFLDQGRHAQAAEAYQIAIARDPYAPDAPQLQERIVLCWSREGRPELEARERERLVASYGESSEWARRNGASAGPSPDVREILSTSRVQSAAAIQAHAAELARAGRREAAKAEYRRAASAYAEVLATSREARGTEGIALARAECTLGAGDAEAAARQFEAVRDASGDPGHQRDAARGAARAWEAAVRDLPGPTGGTGPSASPPPAVLSLAASADALAGRFPDDPMAAPAALRAAASLESAGDHAGARRRLEEIVTRWPRTDTAASASRLLVESHVAARDWAGAEAAASRLRPGAPPGDPRLAADLLDMELTSRFQRAMEGMNEGNCATAARLFLGIVEESPRHSLSDKALHNAALCEERERHLPAASALHGRLASEYPASPLAPEALLRRASIAEAVFDFERAAETYRALLERFPASRQARDALFDRARALEVLQRYEEAGQAFQRYASLSPPPEDAPATLLHASELFEKASAWGRVTRALQDYQRRFAKGTDPESSAVTHLRTGRAEARLGHERAARAAYARAVGDAAQRRNDVSQGPGPSAAAAEAQFRLAELDLPRFDGSSLPPTTRPDRIEKALKERFAEAARLTSLYESVKRFTSPDWTVAALYRQGYVAERLARMLREAPLPPELDRPGNERDRAAYREALQGHARPYEDQAVQAYARASRLAGERRVESAWSRQAAERLVELAPAESGHLRRARGRFLPAIPSPADAEARSAIQALATGDRDVGPMVRLALASVEGGRLELARAVLTSARDLAPGDAAVWNALGRLALSGGSRADAEASWRKAIELDPGHADALANLGQVLVESGDPAAAAPLLERAVHREPGSAAARLDLGNAYRGLGRFEEARRSYEEAGALEPQATDFRYNLGLLPPGTGTIQTSQGGP